MMRRALQVIRRFTKREEGSQTVEFVLMLPLLLWAVGALYVYMDAFRMRSVATKAAYTVADMLSRETNVIDQDYLDGVHGVLNFLNGSNANTRLRVTVVSCDADCETDERRDLRVRWSHSTGSTPTLTDGDLDQPPYSVRIPTLVQGEDLILVETEVDYEPAFAFGLAALTFDNLMNTRPRFARAPCWENCVGS
ncbi:TadE-like protein [Tranquillimonas alkanivorans]|uniref:TadE-like protein n=2 Tax=Tranquillimonas alkanivorans TaxID=441119 RepID=A0A1I5S652_9RHOB|nr:TadE-like protein [Tranquillimonas alkanivorans]